MTLSNFKTNKNICSKIFDNLYGILKVGFNKQILSYSENKDFTVNER